ncbi:MAG: GNAT family N-acetyltransferase, partial [Deltaproteobacteria bacterium]|nr:GNAT family N-acetyltransferase [Deltaproteobacteria bacterium]
MELILRPFRKEDIDALYFLDQRSYPEPYRFSYGQLVSTLLDPRVMAVVLAAEDDPNRPVRLMGALILQQEAVDKRLVILTVMVEPGYRREGLGKKLLDWAFRVGQINGLEEVWSPVEAANGEAMEFFKAAGFA